MRSSFSCPAARRTLPSFPTRRSSDLVGLGDGGGPLGEVLRDGDDHVVGAVRQPLLGLLLAHEDRKSTRLNSSHVAISYAVFCLENKEYTDTLEAHENDSNAEGEPDDE